MDVLDLLKKDHQTVTKLFQRFKDRTDARGTVVRRICDELDAHTRIEEELFYPVVEDAGDADLARMVGEAREEHERVKQHIRTLRETGEDDVDAQIAALELDVERHVTEEEGEMFPRVEEVIDAAQRTQMARRAETRRREIMSASEPTASGGARRTATRRTTKRAGTTKRAQGRRRSTARKRAKGTKARKRARSRSTGAKKRARGGRR